MLVLACKWSAHFQVMCDNAWHGVPVLKTLLCAGIPYASVQRASPTATQATSLHDHVLQIKLSLWRLAV